MIISVLQLKYSNNYQNFKKLFNKVLKIYFYIYTYAYNLDNMIRPLLRTIPTLSGNVKLACTLQDYNTISKNVFETNIRGAHIYPLSSQLFQKSVEANLLSSSWDYDIKRFYNAYSDTFFDPCFTINRQEMPLLDKSENIKPRNIDFEYGVKRISYSKSGCQYACFAPFYIDDVNDIPSYFKLTCKIYNHNKTSHIEKTIIVNIGKNGSDDRNYIYKYLKTYLSRIDNNVIFMDNDKLSVVYYGIDLINGGFTKVEDATVSTLFNSKLPIQLFDYTISEGFKRNNIAIRQVIPMCFYFNVDRLLNASEKTRYTLGSIEFSGAYYNNNDAKIDWYDFSVDYDNFTQDIFVLDTNNGEMKLENGNVQNIMDVVFPSMNDRWISNYLFANKLSKTFNRWRLKYSTDEDPYITNMSYAFSKNQNNNYRYKTFPSNFTNQSGYAEIASNNMYNLVFPLGKTISFYNNLNPLSASKYQAIMNNYCLSWFDVVKSNEFESFENDINWANTDNGYVYYNGILYNLNYVYNRIPHNEKKIDKFAVLVYPKVDGIKDKEYFEDSIKFVSNVIKYDNSTYNSFMLKNIYNTNDNIGMDLFYVGENNKTSVESSEHYDFTNISFDKMLKEVDDSSNIDFTKETIYIESNDLVLESKVINDIETVVKTKNYYDINTVYNIELDELLNFAFSTQTFETLCQKYNLTQGEYNGSNIDEVLEHIYDTKNTDPKPALFSKDTTGVKLYEILPVYKGVMYNKLQIEGEHPLLINDSDDVFKPVQKDFANINNLNNRLNNTYGVQLCKEERFVNAYWLKYYAERLSTNIINNISGTESRKQDLFESFKKFYTDICTSIVEHLSNINPNSLGTYCGHIYYPVLSYNGETIAQNVVIRKQNNFDTSIERISYNYDMDNNVLFMLPYNILGICESIKNVAASTNPYNEISVSDVVQTNENGNTIYKNRFNVLAFLLYNYKYNTKNHINTETIIDDKDIDTKNLFTINETYTFNDLINKYDEITGKLLPDATLENNVNIVLTEDMNNCISDINACIRTLNEENNIIANKNSFELLKTLGIVFEDMYAIVNNVFTLNMFLQFNRTGVVKCYKDEDKITNGENAELVENPITFYKQYKVLDSNYDVKFLYKVLEFSTKQNENLGITFDKESNLFYDTNDKSKTLYNIVMKCKFVKLNKRLVQHMNVLGTDSKFNDLYVFRPLKDIEYDDKFSRFTQLSLANNLEESDSLLSDTSVLYPCFDSVFVENKNESKIVKNFSVDNVTTVKHKIVTKENDVWNTVNIADTYYRYNVDNTSLVLQVNEQVTGLLSSKYYHEEFTKDNLTFEKPTNTVEVFEKFNLTVVDKDGYRYGYYLLTVDLDNTRNVFNIRGILDTNTALNNTSSDYIPNIKYISFINNVDISKNKNYVIEVFKQLCPFMRINLLGTLAENNTIMLPKVFNLQDIYATKVNNSVGARERALIFNNESKGSLSITQLQRYTNSIIPYFVKSDSVTVYNYKYKDVEKMLLETGKYQSIGDIVFNSTKSTISKPVKLNIYTANNDIAIKDFRTIKSSFLPFEYKYFNASNLFNLETQIKVNISQKLKYNQLIEYQSFEKTLEAFKKHITKFGIDSNNEELILFLYKKYSVQYESVPVGVFATGNDKAYKMTYIFNLL